jgi:type I restriction enzyme S subunit
MSDLVRLGDVCRIQNGFAFDSSRFTSTGGMPLIRIRDIGRSACSTYYDGPYDDAYVVRSGDVLVGMDGEFNAAQWTGDQALLNQRVCRLIPDPEALDATYLLHRVKEDLKAIEETTASTTVKHISSKQIAALEWRLPPLNKQRHIAARLNAQLAEVETARQAARAQANDIALLRRRVLTDVFTAVQDAPRKRLGEHAPTCSGSTPPRGVKAYWTPAEVPWVKTGEVAFGRITRTEEAVSRQALAECSLTLLPPGTVLVAMYGQGKTRGQSALLEIAATTNQACFAILPNDTWEPSFLFHWLMASYQSLRELSEGRGGNQANLNGALLDSLDIPAPARAQQASIARRAQAALQEVEALAAANLAQRADLERLPQRLLAQAFAFQGA